MDITKLIKSEKLYNDRFSNATSEETKEQFYADIQNDITVHKRVAVNATWYGLYLALLIDKARRYGIYIYLSKDKEDFYLNVQDSVEDVQIKCKLPLEE